MKKLTYADLTPEFLMELKALGTAEEIADACRRKDFEISAEGAARLLEQFRKAEQLSREKLDDVAGGGKGYSGTRRLFRFLRSRADACYMDGCWDANGNGIDDEIDYENGNYWWCDYDYNQNGIDDDLEHHNS